MKTLTAVLVGAGNRGRIYADYSLDEPTELSIIAVVDPDDLNRTKAQSRYAVPADRCFSDLDDFLQEKIECDFVINATMDQQHYITAKKLLEAGYNMLLEKPIVPKREELLELQSLAHEKNVKVSVCYVLRYTPFFKRIKQLILDGTIGRIMTMEMNEHVGIAHFLDSYVRGKWNSEEKCGSSFLLAKSCHDMDIACWLNNTAKPIRVSSIGSRSQFISENAPAGATEFCHTCPHNDTCLYAAQKVHLEYDFMPYQTWLDIGKPAEEITYEDKEEHLKHSNYGRCAYDCGGDINDRQTVCIEFDNGSLASFTMVGGACKAERYLHIVGTKGEIEGYLDAGRFKLRTFDRSGDRFTFDEELIDINAELLDKAGYDGHGGGDYVLMHDLVRFLNGDNSSISINDIDASIDSHLVVYAADESIRTGKTITV